MSSLDDLRIEQLDGEEIVVQSGMTLEDSNELVRFLDDQMKEIDLNLAKWWAVIEYAKLGA